MLGNDTGRGGGARVFQAYPAEQGARMPKQSKNKKSKEPKAAKEAKAKELKVKEPKAKAPKAQKDVAKKDKDKKEKDKKPKKAKKVDPIPKDYRTVTATLVVSPCDEALAFYEKAFGAKLRPAMKSPDGKVIHAEMKIGDSIVMLADEMPPMPGMPEGGMARKSPKNAGANTGGIMLYVKDVDAFCAKAVEAGASITMPIEDTFWGDRFGQLEDPFGHSWSVATHIRDVSMKEMNAAMEQMFSAPQG
jgi:PhnB protein